jgi:hypothetical protein
MRKSGELLVLRFTSCLIYCGREENPRKGFVITISTENNMDRHKKAVTKKDNRKIPTSLGLM